MTFTNENPTPAPVVPLRPEMIDQISEARALPPAPWMRADTMPTG